jgi:hypothetical protein
MKKKKRKIEGWVWLVTGFVLGILYSNLFLYSDLIKGAELEDKEKLVQVIKEEEKMPIIEEKAEITKELEETTDICKLDEVSCKIKEVAKYYGVDYNLAIAISIHETGRYTSKAFKELNNVGGNFSKGSLMDFDTLEEGIDFFVGNLKRNYIDMGLTSIEEIGNKYCPVGVNDIGVNQYWIPRVTQYYNELKGEI